MQLPETRNAAFVFVKPHAVTPAVNDMVREASKATILKPKELNVPKDKFKEQFKLEWDDALAKGVVFNAMDACTELGVEADKLNELWAASKAAKNLVKFGGGFYCGLVEHGGKSIYVFNGFFMSMRAAFTAPGKSIHYYSVEWDENDLSWEDFRGKLLGPTDPKEAPADSLRGKILADWEKLGLKSEPNVGDNGVHASASPFEGLAERMNWLRAPLTRDPYGLSLLQAGLTKATIKDWSVDPQVKIDAAGKMGSLFDQLEDLNGSDCWKKALVLQGLQG